MACSNSDILALIDYFENGTDLSNNDWDNYNYYDLWNALENGASPPSRTVCATFTQADILSVTLAVLGTFTTPSQYLGFNRDFYYLYLKAIGSEDPSPTFTNECIGALYDVFTTGGGFVGLLDTYSGAAAAYSIRLLSSTYTGPLVQIRKQGDNAINSFYPDSNNELSLNSTDISGTSLSSWIGSENGFIRTWYDQSGNANNAAQTSAASQAQIITAGALNQVNSKASVSFAANYYEINTTVTNTTATIFAVHKNDPSGTYKSIFGNGLNNGWALTTQSSKYNLFYRGVADQATATNAPNNVQALASALTISNTTQITRSQGVEIQNITPAVMTSPTTSARIGAYDNNNNLFTGDMQEILVYNSDNSSNFSGIETNINDFYSIY